MYNVFYIQNFRDPEQPSIRHNLAYETRDAAMARYYTELAQVGNDPTVLESVSAMVFTDECQIIAYTKEVSSYVEPTPETEE